MTISEAIKARISKLRKPFWAFPDDRIELDIDKHGYAGPWATLVSPMQEKLGHPERVKTKWLWIGNTDADWEEWKEPAAV